MSTKKNPNWKQLFENMPSNTSKNKDTIFKPSKIDIKNFGEKNLFEKEKAEFLKRKTKRYKTRKEETTLPNSMKTLIGKYGDIMANVGASDMCKYETYKKYSKKIKSGKNN